ncbi:MAG: acyl-CoA dehydrogenase family protein [Bacillota bacterium]
MDYFELDTNLSDEDLDIKKSTRKFADEVMRPISRELDLMSAEDVIAPASPLWRFLKLAYEQGYHTILLPAEYGGAGLTPLQIHIAFEELARGSMGLTVLLGVACFPSLIACLSCNEVLIEKFVKPFCECKDAGIIGCWPITEPDHGSDVLSGNDDDFYRDPKIRGNLQARLEGDEWVINGQKSAWVSGGSIATQGLLFCQIDPSMGLAGGGICICPLDLPGVSKGKPLEKMGQRDLNQGEIYFDNVRIPREYMFCEPDSYNDMQEIVLASANMAMGVFATGLARAAFEEALAYARVRVQGGKPIIEHRAVKQRLFDMFAKVEACRALSRSVVKYNLANFPPFLEYSIASKTRCTQMAFEVAHEAVQILGGNGLTREYQTEKLFRDARAALIEDGNNESLAAAGGAILKENYPREF